MIALAALCILASAFSAVLWPTIIDIGVKQGASGWQIGITVTLNYVVAFCFMFAGIWIVTHLPATPQ